MTHYKGSSTGGILSYEIGENKITVKFKDGTTYLYDYNRPGKELVEEMKRLAVLGKGLTTYINKHVRENYSATF